MSFRWRQILSSNFSRPASRWVASALVLTACSCSAVQRPIAGTAADPFLDSETPAAAAPSVARETRHHAARPTPPRQEIVLAGLETEDPGQALPERDMAIVRTRAEARLPDCDVCPEVNACPCEEEYPATCATRFPDEYLFDGGDHGPRLHFNDGGIDGLQPEDTLAAYRDECQNRRITPSNCVAIYAPHFAAVISITEPLEDVGGGRPSQSIVTRGGVGLVNRVGTFAQHQRDTTERLVTRIRASGVKSDILANMLDRPIAIQGFIHTTTPLQDFAFLRTGEFKQVEEARLAESIQSAVVWTRDQNPVIAARVEGVIELKSHFGAEEVVGRECKSKAKLRIVKLADRSAAQPSDVITFTIRFDNISDGEVRDVVIIDSLTDRLEYIDDSATCDRKGTLYTEENGEGSSILRWELDEPLAARSGGVVTFQARVR
jgi:uncharacterized repeat protein (TIGR01451 family)